MSEGVAAKPRRPVLAWFLLAVPVALVAGLIWRASHSITKPHISIFDAAQGENIEAVKSHVLTGTAVDSLSESGHTALFSAAGNGDVATVEYLLEHGASPNAEARGKSTPLMMAAQAGNLQVVKDLLARNADLHPVTLSGQTPLHAAASGGNAEIVKLLLDKGLDKGAVRKTDHATPICDAASAGHWNCIKVLKDNGASIDTPGYRGRTPLALTILTRHPETAQELIRAGADVNIADKDHVKPLVAAISADDWATTEMLIPLTKDIDKRDRYGSNAVYYAVVENAPLEIVRSLIDRGCTVDTKDKVHGPLLVARANHNQPMVDLLEHAVAAQQNK